MYTTAIRCLSLSLSFSLFISDSQVVVECVNSTRRSDAETANYHSMTSHTDVFPSRLVLVISRQSEMERKWSSPEIADISTLCINSSPTSHVVRECAVLPLGVVNRAAMMATWQWRHAVGHRTPRYHHAVVHTLASPRLAASELDECRLRAPFGWRHN